MKEIYQTVYSPYYGSVEKVLVNQSSHVYEWETLFLIKTKEQTEVEVSIGVSGYITSVKVAQGQEVTPDTVLSTLRDDLKITGSD
ncbi:biotin/lipoyl-binding protein [Pseudalkalibacillus sp. A8]|uniref:biotin/lipoyl-containing protein n=1 Tax=Pseudalkalibacillus sp. A8 TaxID=3382641 RepID=UPI0038B422D6